MRGVLSKWIALILLVLVLAVPFPASAQGEIQFASLSVGFWPEFDQPSMLVIYDFVLSPEVSLPVDVSLRIPADANLIAVAYEGEGGLLNASFQEPFVEGDWQVVVVTVDTSSVYRIEYYAPITFNGSERKFSFTWPGDYAVDLATLELQIPSKTTQVSSSPELTIEREAGGLKYRSWQAENMAQGEQISFALTYTRTSDALTSSGQPIQAEPVGDDTTGRISMNNYLPYILGGIGLVMIVAGGFYFWQSGKGKSKPSQRHRHRAQVETDDGEQTYCHQCGKRAQPSDRFCRTCGTRLRRES